MKHLPIIRIKVIPHSEQKYDTVGDYWQTKNGNWEMRISEMTPEYELAVIEHELAEMVRTIRDGVKWSDVDKFDTETVYLVDPDNISDPGLSRKAPYHKQHMLSDKIERLIIKQDGGTWEDYNDYLDKMEY